MSFDATSQVVRQRVRLYELIVMGVVEPVQSDELIGRRSAHGRRLLVRRQIVHRQLGGLVRLTGTGRAHVGRNGRQRGLLERICRDGLWNDLARHRTNGHNLSSDESRQSSKGIDALLMSIGMRILIFCYTTSSTHKTHKTHTFE